MAKRYKQIEDELWDKIDTSGGPDACWPWTGNTAHGYGITSDGKKAHRVTYGILVEGIIPGMDICHKCDNPPCCNPAHLFQGTALDNWRDMVRKGRDNGNGRRLYKAKYVRLGSVVADMIEGGNIDPATGDHIGTRTVFVK